MQWATPAPANVSSLITDFFNCGFVEVNEVKKYQRVWVTKPDGSPLGAHRLPLTGDKVLQERYRSWKKQQKVFSQVTDSKQLKKMQPLSTKTAKYDRKCSLSADKWYAMGSLMKYLLTVHPCLIMPIPKNSECYVCKAE